MDFLQSVFGGRVKYFFLAILIFVVGACGVSVGLDAWTEWRTPPEQVVGEALMYAVEAPSYSYTSEASRILDGQMQVISRLQGQKNGENVHLFGDVEVVDSQVDVYQIGDTFYRQEIAYRNLMGYPPVMHMLEVKISSKNEGNLEKS